MGLKAQACFFKPVVRAVTSRGVFPDKSCLFPVNQMTVLMKYILLLNPKIPAPRVGIRTEALLRLLSLAMNSLLTGVQLRQTRVQHFSFQNNLALRKHSHKEQSTWI